jgi:hypothetical protein
MSLYDQQLASLQSQYGGFMSKLPSLGVSKAAIDDAKQALDIQRKMQSLANQYLTAQQAQLNTLETQKSNDLKTSQKNLKLYQTNADTSVNLYNQAIAQKNSPFGIYKTQEIKTPDSSSPTGYKTMYTRKFKDDPGATLSNLGTEISKGIPTSGLSASQQQIAKSITDPYKLSQTELGIVQASDLAASKLTDPIGKQSALLQKTQEDSTKMHPQFSQTQSALQQLMQKYQQMQTTASNTSGNNIANVGIKNSAISNTPAAAKGGAAAAQQVSGMPQKQQSATVAQANQTGQASSPFTLPNFTGLTFGGN